MAVWRIWVFCFFIIITDGLAGCWLVGWILCVYIGGEMRYVLFLINMQFYCIWRSVAGSHIKTAINSDIKCSAEKAIAWYNPSRVWFIYTHLHGKWNAMMEKVCSGHAVKVERERYLFS